MDKDELFRAFIDGPWIKSRYELNQDLYDTDYADGEIDDETLDLLKSQLAYDPESSEYEEALSLFDDGDGIDYDLADEIIDRAMNERGIYAYFYDSPYD